MDKKAYQSLLESWTHEKQSAYLYEILAQAECEPHEQNLFAKLAVEAEEQANLWLHQIEQHKGQAPPKFSPGLRLLILKHLIKFLGAKAIRPILSATKIRGMSVYNSHSHIGHHPMPQTVAEIGLRHHSSRSGNNLRAAVFGVNDGLVSNTSLILGMVGGHATHSTLLLAGIAGLLAGAFSMAAGEYVSVRSQREMLEYQLEQERKELELYPNEEAAELALIYHARGLGLEEARKMAHTIIQDPEQALITLAKEELGLDPTELVSPYSAAIFSCISFMIGAGIPLLPFLFIDHTPIAYAIGFSALALFLVGNVISLYTGKNTLFNGLRMLLIGGGAGVLTYVIGHLISSVS